MSAAIVQPRADGPIEHGLLVGMVAALATMMVACSSAPPRPLQPKTELADEVCDAQPLVRVLLIEEARRKGDHVGCGNVDPLLEQYRQLASEADDICAAPEDVRVADLWRWYERGWYLGCLKDGTFEIGRYSKR